MIYDLGKFGFPEIPYFAGQDLPRSEPILPMHIHKGLMEICYLYRGERYYRVGGEEYRLGANQVFVAWPDEIHGSGSQPHGRGALYWMQVRLPEPGTAFLGSSGSHTDALAKALNALPRRHFTGDKRMASIFVEVMEACANPGDVCLRANLVAARLTHLFMIMLECAGREQVKAISPEMQTLKEWMDRRPLECRCLADLAAMAGLSESRFKARFTEEVGLAPGDYILRAKVNKAREMLRNGNRGITQIALDLGFCSHQHFTDTYRRYIGVSPSCHVSREKDGGKCEYGIDRDNLIPWYHKEFCHGYFVKEAVPQ